MQRVALRGEKPQNRPVSKNNTAAELPAADPAGNNQTEVPAASTTVYVNRQNRKKNIVLHIL